MENLKEMGLKPIDENQAENVNGGININIRIEYCCVNIPPMDIPTYF